ncbi:MAG: sensor histidine kinase [Cyclobacteriaceae bacterium]
MIQHYSFEKILGNRLLLNILFWVFYAVIPFFWNLGRFGSSANMYTDIQFYVECMVLGYFNNFVLLKYLFDRKKYLPYFLSILTLSVSYNFLSTHISLWLSPGLTNSDLMTLYNLIDLLIFILAFSAARLLRQQIRQNYEISRLQEEKLQNEVDFLKSQINPHLLFNTLNTIYSAALENSQKVPEMILSLSGLMRFMLYETNDKQVLLEKEIEYIKNYIALQKLRIENRGHVKFDLSGNPENLMIAPVLLISFVENAFKHSMNSLADDIRIDIALDIKENTIVFNVCNNYDYPAELTNPSVGGLGIINSKKRLDLLYRNRHDLSIKNDNGMYEITLIIDLKND